MRIKKRIGLAAVIAPAMILGIMVQPAQAAAGIYSCGPAGGKQGFISFNNATTATVSAKAIYPGHPEGWARAIVTDYGTVGYTRTFSADVPENGVWRVIQGPYSRKAGGLVHVNYMMGYGGVLTHECYIDVYI